MSRRPLPLVMVACLLLLGYSSLTVRAAPPTHTAYFPLVSTRPASPQFMGAEIQSGMVSSRATERMGEANMSWTRYNQLTWELVEPTKGTYNWEAVARMDADLIRLSRQGLTPILIIHGTPAWARQIPTRSCGPIKPSELQAFGDFMAAVVNRYSRPPFNIYYYELFNEPDIDPSFNNGDHAMFGCWGDATSPTYGGQYYSAMLDVVYPRIKAAHAQAQVLIGGLMLLCDPEIEYPDGRDCTSARYIDGILQHGGGRNFDMISFHGYSYQTQTRTDWERDFPLWNHRGGVMLGKVDYLRDRMRAYGVDKPLIMTESGLLCWPGGGCDSDQTLLRQDQAIYVVRSYVRAKAINLVGLLWYTFDGPGWRRSGILDEQQNPQPAFYAMRFMESLLTDATVVEAYWYDYGKVEGYRLTDGNRTIWILWANQDGYFVLPFGPPPGANYYNKEGLSVPPPTDNRLTVGFEPLIIVQE